MELLMLVCLFAIFAPVVAIELSIREYECVYTFMSGAVAFMVSCVVIVIVVYAIYLWRYKLFYRL